MRKIPGESPGLQSRRPPLREQGEQGTMLSAFRFFPCGTSSQFSLTLESPSPALSWRGLTSALHAELQLPPSRPAPHREHKGASQLDSEARRECTWDPERMWGPVAGRQYPPLRPQPEDPATSSSGSGPLSPPRHVQSLRGQPGREKKVQSLFWETLGECPLEEKYK